MTERNPYPLDLEPFVQFLRASYLSNEPVGFTCDDGDCPLSHFLGFLYGGYWLVNYHCYSLYDEALGDGGTAYVLPSWAMSFVSLLDRFVGFQRLPVPARSALQVLPEALANVGLSWEVC